MDLELKYMQIYDLSISNKSFKGIYLGKKRLKGKFSHKHAMLTTKPTMLYSYSLFGFNRFKFEKEKLIMGYYSQKNIPENQRFFYQNLLETKLKE